MDKKEICLLNDSFPPIIDGVSNAVVNYAENLKNGNYDSIVVVPDYPGSNDSGFDFPVIRYPSVDLRNRFGYTAGNPFVPKTMREIGKRDIALLHSHCPIASNFLARGLREKLDVPIVMTYHTKFDIEISNSIKGKMLRYEAIKALVESVSSVDELWVVSRGAGENIRNLGYMGEYIVMPNGVDMPKKKAAEGEIIKAVADYDLPGGVPLFLFVGRLMWYKGLRTILDALAALRSQNIDFRMVFIGGGGDENEVKAYTSSLKLDENCFFTGPIHDRNVISAWYSRADLFLFPSSFDTNGLVVREAAACSLATVMLKDSCAAEGVTNGVNGLLIDDNPASLAVCLTKAIANKTLLKKIGENAANDLYLSWEDAVKNAEKRYEIVIENYRSGRKNKRHDLTDDIFVLYNDLVDAYEKIDERVRKSRNE